jgi:hypothetical protein
MRIFKYTNGNSNSMNILSNSQIYCSLPYDFNDPFDCTSSIEFGNDYNKDPYEFFCKLMLDKFEEDNPDVGKELKKATLKIVKDGNVDYVKEYILKIYHDQFGKTDYQTLGVSCFSKNNNNILMWSHYANNHKGIVFEFDTNDKTFIHCEEVKYSEEYYKYNLNTFHDRSYSLLPLYTKAKYWEYEQEVRYVHPYGAGLVDFDPNSVKGIYLGCKSDENIFKEVSNVLLKTKRNIPIYKANKHFEMYSLTFQKIN